MVVGQACLTPDLRVHLLLLMREFLDWGGVSGYPGPCSSFYRLRIGGQGNFGNKVLLQFTLKVGNGVSGRSQSPEDSEVNILEYSKRIYSRYEMCALMYDVMFSATYFSLFL